jgi:hypothetical protein
VVAVTLCGGVANAGSSPSGGGSLESQLFSTCGKWVLKLRDFGKMKLANYNSYVPEQFQSREGTVSQLFQFGTTGNPNLGAGEFSMFVNFPDQMGVYSTANFGFGIAVRGTYNQRGKKVNFFPTAAGIVALEQFFGAFGENTLFGDPKRQLVVSIPYSEITNPDALRFKGRVKDGGDRLKVKFKAKMLYDIQFENGSEFADIFNAKGRFKLRADSNKCPATPPPPSP